MDLSAGTTEVIEEVTKEKLIRDIKVVMRDAEVLLKATAGDLSEKAKEARVRLGEAMARAKVSIQKLEDQALDGVKATDRIIRERPYHALGIAFGIGLLVAVLVNRR